MGVEREGHRGAFWDGGMRDVVLGMQSRYVRQLIPNSVPRTEHFIVYNGHKKSSRRTFCFRDLHGMRMVTGTKLPRRSDLGPRSAVPA